MSDISPRLLEFAGRVLRSELNKGDPSGGFIVAFDRACSDLHDRLAPLISSAGVHTLIGRALQLASRDFQFLAAVTVPRDGRCSLAGLPAAVDGCSSEEVADAMTAVLAQFIRLLVTFIGENLGLRKLGEVWPDVPLDRTDSSAGTE
jgi:hypothetical protein